MADILVTTVPFGEIDPTPIKLIADLDITYEIVTSKAVLSEEETRSRLQGVKYLIAGTEKLSADTLSNCSNLKLISRVGIGLDSVDLSAAKKLGISVAYTPDGPTGAVVELTIGLMLDQMRRISNTDAELRRGLWHRTMGSRLHNTTFGIIGAGRIGSGVINLLIKMGAKRVVYYDIDKQIGLESNPVVSRVDLESLLNDSDIVSLHLPLSTNTRHFISTYELSKMKQNASIINTSRGGIVDEEALRDALNNKRIKSAAIDVFQNEPYYGPLTLCRNCTLTAHMGSMSFDCRAKMEIEATENVIKFIKGKKDYGQIPETEYQNI